MGWWGRQAQSRERLTLAGGPQSSQLEAEQARPEARRRRVSEEEEFIMEYASFPFQVGHFNCLVINDANEGNSNCLLIDTGQHKVLVETGIGDSASPPGLLLERLQ